MRQDDDRYLDSEEDKDFWDDELELTSDDSDSGFDHLSRQSYESGGSYPPYDYNEHAPYHDSYHDDYIDSTGEEETQDTTHIEEPEDYYSDPEPEPKTRSRRERFFGKKNVEEEETEDNDYFDSDADTEPAIVRKPKAPKLDPEDPDYWIGDEDSPLSGIMTGTSKKWIWQLGAAIAILILILGAWLWFFRPYADSAVKYGYIKNMERRGSIIKTFEGTIIPYKELGDPNPLYFQEIGFSVESDSLAAVMKRMMLGCVPVRVEYEMYHTPLPWKGEERMIITKADTADPKKILPPEYR